MNLAILWDMTSQLIWFLLLCGIWHRNWWDLLEQQVCWADPLDPSNSYGILSVGANHIEALRQLRHFRAYNLLIRSRIKLL
jgi:hypothetical protein